MKIYIHFVPAILLFSLHFSGFSQLVINSSMTETQLVQNVLLGPGLNSFNITSSSAAGTGVSIGQFTNGNTTNLGITSGVVLSTGSIFNIPNTGGSFASSDNGSGTDSNLSALASASIYDATWLQFDFIPTSSQVTFRYVFGSEEYPEYVNSGYNDVFGFFISGPNPGGGTYNNVNLALIPSTMLPVSIDNVNSGSYSQYYTDNSTGATIVFDGFTHVLTATCIVLPCQTYHIKFAVGDAGDGAYDSGIFLEAGSFTGNNPFYILSSVSSSNPAISQNAKEGCTDAIVTLSKAAPDTVPVYVHFTIEGTAINGIDYVSIPDSVLILAGAASLSFMIQPLQDTLTEGMESIQLIFSSSPCSVDTIIVNIDDYSTLIAKTFEDTTVCNNSQIELSVNVTGGNPPYSYQWTNGEINDSTIVYPTGQDTIYTYAVTVTDLCLFQSSDSITVTVLSVQTPVISSNGNVILNSNSTTGNQWYNSTGTINGATSQTYTALTDDLYFVIVTENGCVSDTSNIITITGTNTGDNLKENTIKIFPNPVKTILYLELYNTSLPTLCVIANTIGAVKYSGYLKSNSKIDLTDYPEGVYFLKLITNKKTFEKKIIKQ